MIQDSTTLSGQAVHNSVSDAVFGNFTQHSQYFIFVTFIYSKWLCLENTSILLPAMRAADAL